MRHIFFPPSIILWYIIASILVLKLSNPIDSKMPTTFHNKYAIVTGGSRGIGASIALLLAERGARGVCSLQGIQLQMLKA